MNRFLLLALLLAAAPLAQAQWMPVTTTSDDARVHFEQGRARMAHADFAAARTHLDAALAADPAFGLAHLYRAVAEAGSGSAVSDAHMRQAAAARVSDSERQLIESYAAHLRGDHDAELAALTAVAGRFPADPWPTFQLGNELTVLERYDEAAAAYRRTTAADPSFAGAYNLLGYNELRRGDAAAAERAFREYIRMAPDEANPYDSYGEFLMLSGRLDEAETQFEMALARDPEFAVSRTNLARIGIERSDLRFEQAVAAGDADAIAALYTENAVIMPPNSPPITGRAAIRDYMAGLVASGVDGVDIETVEVMRFDDMAVERADVTIRVGGVVVEHGKSLVLWRLVGDEWLYVRDMWSANEPATTASN